MAENPKSPKAAVDAATGVPTMLSYPKDVENLGHYMIFYINGSYSPSLTGITTAVGSMAGAVGNILPDMVTSEISGSVTNLINGAQNAIGKYGAQKATYTTSYITMYIPDTMAFGQQVGWNSTSIHDMGKALVGGIGAATKDATRQALNAFTTVGAQLEYGAELLGYAFNPQLLVLFKGIGFRTYQFDFYFSPKDEGEAENIRNIIKSFRMAAHPALHGTAGIFYEAPSSFNIAFFHNGKQNTNIPMLENCVLLSYDVDYAPYGWTTFTDGMPARTSLSLRFQETGILDRGKIDRGY